MVPSSAMFSLPGISQALPCHYYKYSSFSFRPQSWSGSLKKRRNLVPFAQNEDSRTESTEGGNGNNGREELKREKRHVLNLKWRDLLDPDPENILAVALTGLLTFASVQVLWQLFFISIAILVAALKALRFTRMKVILDDAICDNLKHLSWSTVRKEDAWLRWRRSWKSIIWTNDHKTQLSRQMLSCSSLGLL